LIELPLLTDAEDAEVNRHEFILDDTAQEASVAQVHEALALALSFS